MNIYNDCPQAPCKGCTDRWMNEEEGTICHSTCEKFQAFEKIRQAKRDEFRKKADQLRSLNMIGRRWK